MSKVVIIIELPDDASEKLREIRENFNEVQAEAREHGGEVYMLTGKAAARASMLARGQL